MNWTKASAIAEILSSFAIVATLAYLAIQTQQNTAALVSASRQEMLSSELQLLQMQADYPVGGFRDLFTPEENRERIIYLAMIRTREHLWMQTRDGLIDETVLRSYLPPLLGAIRTEEFMGLLWNNSAEVLDPGFVAYVDGLLAADTAQDE